MEHKKFVMLPPDLNDLIMDALKNAGMSGYMTQLQIFKHEQN